jgi:hypothetical protein
MGSVTITAPPRASMRKLTRRARLLRRQRTGAGPPGKANDSACSVFTLAECRVGAANAKQAVLF